MISNETKQKQNKKKTPNEKDIPERETCCRTRYGAQPNRQKEKEEEKKMATGIISGEKIMGQRVAEPDAAIRDSRQENGRWKKPNCKLSTAAAATTM